MTARGRIPNAAIPNAIAAIPVTATSSTAVASMMTAIRSMLLATKRPEDKPNATANTNTKEATSDFFWLMIFLFLSIGFNVYLVWVAWQTYWKYRDLVSDTRTPRTASESY